MAQTDRWTQFHADRPNQGAVSVRSAHALRAMWSVDIGNNFLSSPVIGDDGTIYVGNQHVSQARPDIFLGELVAVDPKPADPTRRIKWRSTFGGAAILSSPSVGEDGNIYVITTSEVETGRVERLASTLHRVAPADGTVSWSFPFPNHGVSLSSPKTWRSPRGEVFVFVYARGTAIEFGAPTNELFVFNSAGNMVRRERVHTCAGAVVGTIDVRHFFKNVWKLLKVIFEGFHPTGYNLLTRLKNDFWFDPTVAIEDDPGFGPPNQPIVVVVDPCGIWAFRWNPPNLEHIRTGPNKPFWRQYIESDRRDFKLSSPLSLRGMLVLARQDGRVLAYNLETQEKLWEQRLGKAVFGTPASFGGGPNTYLTSLQHIHRLDFNGELLDTQELPLVPLTPKESQGETVASPAITRSHVYVSSTGGMISYDRDLRTYSVDRNVVGYFSSPAVARDGTVYVVGEDREGGRIRLFAYPGP